MLLNAALLCSVWLVAFKAGDAFRVKAKSALKFHDESKLTHAPQASHVVPQQRAALLVATNKSLSLVQQVSPLLETELAKLSIPSASGRQSGFEWVVSTTASNPVVGTVEMEFIKGVGVKLLIPSVRIDAITRLTVKGTEWHNSWLSFDTRLSTTPSVSNVAIRLGLGIADGQPSIEVLDLNFDFSLGNVRWSQGDSHAINAVLQAVRPKMEALIEKELKTKLENFASNDLQNELTKFNMKIPLNMEEPFKSKELHTEMISLEVHEDRIASDLRVKLADPDDPSTGLWITTATPLPEDYDAEKMLTLTLAPELFEFFIGDQHKNVKHVVKKGEAGGWLTTNSLRYTTSPKLNSGLFGAQFGTQDMQAVVSIGGNTSIKFRDGYIEVAAPTIFKFEVMENDTAPVLAFEASQLVHMDCEFAIANGTLQSGVSNVNIEDFTITKKHDSIWWVWRRSISGLIDLAEHQIVLDEEHALSDLKLGEQLLPILENSYMRVIPGGLTIRSDIPV